MNTIRPRLLPLLLLPLLLAAGCAPRRIGHAPAPHHPGGPDWVTMTGRAVVNYPGGGADLAPAPAPAPPAAPEYYALSGVVRAEGFGAPRPGASPAQARLLAERAAITDARRNLLETLKGVQLSSTTYVRDFIAQSDQVTTEVNGYLQGAQVVDKSADADGVVRVVMEIDLDALNRIVERYAVATTPPPSAPAAGYGSGGPRPGGPAARQAELMALRGAQLDAERQLLEYAKGIQLQSGTYVRDYITERDDIASRVQGYIRRAEKIDEGIRDGVAEVTLRMDMNVIRANIR